MQLFIDEILVQIATQEDRLPAFAALQCAPVEKCLDLQEAGRCAEVIGDDRDAVHVTKQEMIKHALAL